MRYTVERLNARSAMIKGMAIEMDRTRGRNMSEGQTACDTLDLSEVIDTEATHPHHRVMCYAPTPKANLIAKALNREKHEIHR